MNRRQESEITAHSKSVSRLLPSIVELATDYAIRQKFADKYRDEFAELAGVWEKLPEEWAPSILEALVAASVMTGAASIAGLLRSSGNELSPEARRLLKGFRDEPWFFTVFVPTDTAGTDLHYVQEIDRVDSGGIGALSDVLGLYSPAVRNSAAEGASVFFALLFWNGKCYQTYGPVLGFSNMNLQDLAFFASKFKSGDVGGLSQLAARHAPSFYALAAFLKMPTINGPNGIMEYCHSAAPLATVSPQQIIGTIEKSGDASIVTDPTETLMLIIVRGPSPPEDVEFVIDLKNRKLHLSVYSIAEYKRSPNLLPADVHMPVEPQDRCSILMYTAAKTIIGDRDETFDLELRVEHLLNEDTKDQRRHKPDEGRRRTADEHGTKGGNRNSAAEDLNEALAMISDSFNSGGTPDGKAIADQTGLDLRQVKLLIQQTKEALTRVSRKSPVPNRFGLSPKDLLSLTHGGVPSITGVLRFREASIYESSVDVEGIFRYSAIMRSARWMIKRIGTHALKLTGAGYLPPSVVREAVESGEVPVEGVPFYSPSEEEDDGFEAMAATEIKKESDWPFLSALRDLLEHEGFVVSDGRALRVSDAGYGLVETPARAHWGIVRSLFENERWGELRKPSFGPRIHLMTGLLLYVGHLIASESVRGAFSEKRFMDTVLPFVGFRYIGEGTQREQASREIASMREEMLAVSIHVDFIVDFAAGAGLFEIDTTKRPLELRLTSIFDAMFETGSKGRKR